MSFIEEIAQLIAACIRTHFNNQQFTSAGVKSKLEVKNKKIEYRIWEPAFKQAIGDLLKDEVRQVHNLKYWHTPPRSSVSSGVTADFLNSHIKANAHTIIEKTSKVTQEDTTRKRPATDKSDKNSQADAKKARNIALDLIPLQVEGSNDNSDFTTTLSPVNNSYTQLHNVMGVYIVQTQSDTKSSTTLDQQDLAEWIKSVENSDESKKNIQYENNQEYVP